MDLFRFRSTKTQPLSGGELLLPTESITWAERYRDAGEVTIISDVSSGVKQQLPVGTMVSHIDTEEVFRIENHETEDNGDDVQQVKTTGRSLEAPILEQRAVGSNREWPTTGPPEDYTINGAWSTQTQVVSLITRHIDPAFLVDDNDAIAYLEALTDITEVLTTEERKIKAGLVYDEVLKLLAVDDLGIRVKRPHAGEENTQFIIHKGRDLSSSVTLSVEAGDIKSTQSLESDKKLKNSALIVGRWVQTVIVSSQTGVDRRWMVVDASDIDQAQETVPSGGARALIVSAMQARGREALAKQAKISLTNVEAAPNAQVAEYRTDYLVGDIVLVLGSQGEKTKMRVKEYVEIQDETGFTGYPTLELLEGDT